MKYKSFKRTNKKYTTLVPKQFMTAKSFVFLVREELAHKFPKRGICFKSIHMADMIFADGHIIKNILGPSFQARQD